MKARYIIGVVVLALFVSILLVDLLGSASTFSDFESAKREGKTVHVVGRWVKREQAKFDPANNFNSFYVQDSLKHIAEVRYYEALTGDMSNADKIDIVGKYENGVFVADKIHLKCPSKYNDTKGSLENKGGKQS